MEGKIILSEKLESGKELVIRYPKTSDAQDMLSYINTISDERTFITYQGEHETPESEIKFLKSKLEEISKRKSVMLLAFVDKQISGISGVDLGTKTQRHVGLLGITVVKEFRGLGVGKRLMASILKEAKSNLVGLEILTLGVFSCNLKAMDWYKRLGFKEEGRLPNGVKLENGYQDHIYMYMSVI